MGTLGVLPSEASGTPGTGTHSGAGATSSASPSRGIGPRNPGGTACAGGTLAWVVSGDGVSAAYGPWGSMCASAGLCSELGVSDEDRSGGIGEASAAVPAETRGSAGALAWSASLGSPVASCSSGRGGTAPWTGDTDVPAAASSSMGTCGLCSSGRSAAAGWPSAITRS